MIDSFPCFYFYGQPEMKSGHFMPAQHIFYIIYPLPSLQSHGYFLYNSSMSSSVHFSFFSFFSILAFLTPLILTAVNHISKPFFCKQKGLVYFFNYLYGIFWYTVFHILFFYVQPENRKWSLKMKWIILGLLMKKPLHWFETKIMIITVHQIQAG